MTVPSDEHNGPSGRPGTGSTGEEPSLAGESTAAHDAYADLAALAHSSVSQTRFLADALKSITLHFASPYAAIHVRYASEVLQDDWHTGPTDPQFWKQSLQDFLTESLATPKPRAKVLKAKTGRSKIAFLSAPLMDEESSAIGALALVVALVDADEVATRLVTLEGLTRQASLAAQFIGASRAKGTSAAAPNRALIQASAYNSDVELAFAITNELRNKIGCEQVALGIVERNRVKVVSISGLDGVSKQTPGCVSLRAAMEECVDAKRPIVYQKAEGWAGDSVGTGHRLHKQWHESAKGSAVASIPLCEGDEPVAILSLRRRADEPFTQEKIDAIRKNVEPFGAALMLTRRATRTLTRHGIDSIHTIVETLTARGRPGTKTCSLLGVLAALWFTFGTITYELTVPCVVMSAQVRHVTAPLSGVLASAAVLEGDQVAQGQVLCRFDHRDLDLKQAELRAELAVLERTKDRAVAEDSPVEVQLALANQQLTRAKLDIVRRKTARATLKAPFDGIVVAGDLRKRVGSVLALGDPLFEVAPLQGMTLQMHVPDSASADLSVGLAGTFATYARPDQTREVKILRVLAQARIHENKNVYSAEADISAEDDWMRPGMEGVARIAVGPRPVWWVALHKAIDYVRMKLWL